MTAALILLSLGCVTALALLDPKRRRTGGWPPTARRRLRLGLTLLALSPACWFATSADAAGLLIWIGALTVGGWAVTCVAGLRPHRR